jgi:glycosyltransferase involved in cell wall biosynthesis
MTEIVYPVNLRFPMERANSIQIVQTCHALARGGTGVTLLVRGGKDPTSEVASLAFYGLAPHRNLRIRRLPVLPPSAPARLRNRLFSSPRRRPRRPRAGPGGAFYVRDDGVARMLIGARAILRAPVIFEMHHLSHLFLKARHEMYPGSPALPPADIARQARIDRRLYERADAIVCVTQALADLLAGTFGPRPGVHVVRNGVTLPAGSPASHPEKGLVTYVGQLYPWKGLERRAGHGEAA